MSQASLLCATEGGAPNVVRDRVSRAHVAALSAEWFGRSALVSDAYASVIADLEIVRPGETRVYESLSASPARRDDRDLIGVLVKGPAIWES